MALGLSKGLVYDRSKRPVHPSYVVTLMTPRASILFFHEPFIIALRLAMRFK
jgi:hypothetical protein